MGYKTGLSDLFGFILLGKFFTSVFGFFIHTPKEEDNWKKKKTYQSCNEFAKSILCLIWNIFLPYLLGWREIDGYKSREEGKLNLLEDLFHSIKSSRPADASELKDARTPGSSPLHPRKSTMRKSLKNLFSSAPKFQRSLKRYFNKAV